MLGCPLRRVGAPDPRVLRRSTVSSDQDREAEAERERQEQQEQQQAEREQQEQEAEAQRLADEEAAREAAMDEIYRPWRER
jgi:hypothetical protein